MNISRKFSALVLVGLFGTPLSETPNVQAHGTIVVPPSRVYECRFNGNPENHQDPACRAAIELGGTQPMYDWNGIRQGNANGQHRALIPDGQQCSGGNPTFKGLDLLRSDWRTTKIAPNANGQFEFVYNATAPHATAEMIFYVTPQGFDPAQPIRWNELEEFCRHGQTPLKNIQGGGRGYRLSCDLPQRTGRHVIFHVWQRSDSPEAFYACSDVEFMGGIVNDDLRDLGKVAAMDDLQVGTKIIFRLFNENATDLETIQMTVEAGQQSRSLWPFFLAQRVNASSTLVRVGALNGNGEVEPTQTLNGNRVFTHSPQGLSFVIDKEVPDGAPDGNPDGNPDGDNSRVDFTYPEGIGSYQPGTVVRGTTGALFQCKPFPFSGWCNQAPFYYAPGTGLAWEQAWSQTLQP